MASRNTLILKLTAENETRTEGVVLEKSNNWNSPSGGWLAAQSGTWDQLPSGVVLNATGKPHVADLEGLNFYTSEKGASGKAKYPQNGDAGKWTVVDFTELDRRSQS